jgi:hypothetical protein
MSKKKAEIQKKEKKNSPPIKEEEKKPFDFGGLPQRDLKKSLGCG